MVEYRIAEVAQLAERLYRKQQVAGPIPAFGSNIIYQARSQLRCAGGQARQADRKTKNLHGGGMF